MVGMKLITESQLSQIKKLAEGNVDAEYILKAAVGAWPTETGDYFLRLAEQKRVSGAVIIRAYELKGTVAHFALQVATCPGRFFDRYREVAS